jgi:uncharacterized protein DUF4062/iSTAND domain-containing protein
MATAKRQVFISSTAKDLAEFRTSTITQVERLDGWKCVNMERFGARAGPTVDACKELVQSCDLFLGIVGHLYGSCPRESSTSYTEHEYEAAVTKGIPRLMFIAQDSVAVSAELRAADSHPHRQRVFRDRVQSSGEIVGSFDSPLGLAADAATAIANYVFSRIPLPPDPSRRGRGEIVSKLCNRAIQEMQFWKGFSSAVKKTPGLPQIYIIRGDEKEAPGSLVSRFRFKNIQEYANKLWPTEGAVSYKSPSWPATDDEKTRQARLAELLFDAWEAGPVPDLGEEKAGAVFARKTAPRREKIMILKHEIRAADWDLLTLDTFKWYLSFWDDAGQELTRPQRSSTPPQLVIFLGIIYSDKKSASGWLRWLPGAGRFDSSALERDLLSILNARQTRVSDSGEQLCPVCMLDPLSCVKRDDVMTWFSANQIFDDEPFQCRKFADEIFKNEECRHMDELEFELQNILDKSTAAT